MAAEYRIRPITRDEYHRMGEIGIIEPHERVELLDGELIAMPPIGPDHSFSVLAFNDLLSRTFQGRALVHVQSSFVLDLHSEPEPDFMLLAPPLARYRGRLPATDDLHLVIEISNASWAYDRKRKYRAYARAGVAEFWIVHLAERRVYQFREPKGDRYMLEQSFGAGESLAPAAFPADLISVDAILP